MNNSKKMVMRIVAALALVALPAVALAGGDGCPCGKPCPCCPSAD